ncbi:hypothetical protein K2173_012393 [Erythroxylum novogranatense]|uniref:Uncharacterized protein n=1 Tax=Erythroxylum novogranatense TaxID=1862640 RepID=A0AAV8UD13_9ROSI|nr:hypothetical protein K2173_012393 [Erythroxylum novogranatense]
MEPAKIDWKRVESIFVEDRLYENINAPKWVDLLAHDEPSIDDESWFCRPDCNHPKKAEDFLKTPPSSKFSSLAEKTKSLLSDWNQRDAKLTRRGQIQSSFGSNDKTKSNKDAENQNPNIATPSNHQAKFMKESIKSSTERKKPTDDISSLERNEAPRLKNTLSARNLFAGKDIISHIAEFCNELKKMATRARERENDEKLNKDTPSSEVSDRKDSEDKMELEEAEMKEKEREPLLEVSREECDRIEKGRIKEKQRRIRRVDEAENIPVSLNLATVKNKAEERLLQIRTNPPSPQCFSTTRTATKSTTTTTTPLKASKSRLMDRGILQEVKQNKEMARKEETENKVQNFPIVDGRETKGMDVFWFLKPCTLSS